MSLETELAWAAGFFDGEGHFRTVRSGRPGFPGVFYVVPVAQILQVDRHVLDRFQDAVGVGRVFGPYPYKGTEWRDRFYYRASSAKALRRICESLMPFLSPVKIAQAKKMWEEYDARERKRSD